MKNDLAVVGVEPSTPGTGGDSFNNHTTLRLVLLGLKIYFLALGCDFQKCNFVSAIGAWAETKTQTGKRKQENANIKTLLKMAPKAFIFGSITEVSLAK